MRRQKTSSSNWNRGYGGTLFTNPLPKGPLSLLFYKLPRGGTAHSGLEQDCPRYLPACQSGGGIVLAGALSPGWLYSVSR